jgi:hypothetical protein
MIEDGEENLNLLKLSLIEGKRKHMQNESLSHVEFSEKNLRALKP